MQTVQDWGDAVLVSATEALQNFLGFLPALVGAILILVIGWILGSRAAAGRGEAGSQRFEIFHVWPEDDRLARKHRFAGVLPAFAEETFADHDDIGVGRPVAQFAS